MSAPCKTPKVILTMPNGPFRPGESPRPSPERYGSQKTRAIERPCSPPCSNLLNYYPDREGFSETMRLKMPLKIHRLLSLLAFVLALIGGVLLVVSPLGGLGRLSIGSLAINGLVFLFGLGAILGGWLIYTGTRKLGGIITLLAGIILFVLTGGAGTAVLLVIVAGVLGLVAAEMKPWWAFWR